MEVKKWTRENAKINIERYCAYQERCHSEVRNKLLSHGIYGDLLEELISSLIENNFLNEERFAALFAGGKFRIKYWGRIKIQLALKAKGVSDYSIREALVKIDPIDYTKAINYWITRKGIVKKGISFVDKMELIKFLHSKGFEMESINEALSDHD